MWCLKQSTDTKTKWTNCAARESGSLYHRARNSTIARATLWNVLYMYTKCCKAYWSFLSFYVQSYKGVHSGILVKSGSNLGRNWKTFNVDFMNKNFYSTNFVFLSSDIILLFLFDSDGLISIGIFLTTPEHGRFGKFSYLDVKNITNEMIQTFTVILISCLPWILLTQAWRLTTDCTHYSGSFLKKCSAPYFVVVYLHGPRRIGQNELYLPPPPHPPT